MKDDPVLSQLLQESKESCEVSRDFQAQVWRKIALRADQRPVIGGLGFWSWIRQGSPEVRWGVSMAVLVIMGGLILGQIQASAESRHVWSSLEGKYVSSIDPYAQSGHGDHQ